MVPPFRFSHRTGEIMAMQQKNRCIRRQFTTNAVSPFGKTGTVSEKISAISELRKKAVTPRSQAAVFRRNMDFSLQEFPEYDMLYKIEINV